MLNNLFTQIETGHVHEQRELNVAGFTLIELLVVIAVLGILASVVLVAINPAERMNEARDAGRKSDVGQVSVALESYYATYNGSYNGVSSTTLVSAGQLKRFPSEVTLVVASGNLSVAAYTTLSSASLGVCTDTRYWCYTSTDGSMTYKCLNHTPLVTCL